MDKQTIRIEEGGVLFADYDGPITRFKVRHGADDVKVTVWLPREEAPRHKRQRP